MQMHGLLLESSEPATERSTAAPRSVVASPLGGSAPATESQLVTHLCEQGPVVTRGLKLGA